MAAASYDEALKRLLVHEGGYGNHPNDPGGPTNFGITLADYRSYINPAGTAHDVEDMSVDQAKGIYKGKYWNKVRGDELPAGVDYAVFDYGVNSGVSRAAKVLQRIVGVEADGEIGPATIAAARSRDPKVLVGAICDERLAFLKALKTWHTFGKGWGTRVAQVRDYSVQLAGASQSVVPNRPAEIKVLTSRPPWLVRMDAIMGLYEFPGQQDNPAIIAMAKACGGKIEKTYKHDATPWCALTVNYCLKSCGLPGDDSLWALDFRNYGLKLDGPAIGAIATKTRDSGGHVFLVVGKDRDGFIIGRGGNQTDMVCDTIFDPRELRYNWPSGYPLPAHTGIPPMVTLAPKAKKDVVLLPATKIDLSGKGVVPAPAPIKTIVAPAGGVGAAAGVTWSEWIGMHPWETGAIVAGTVVVVSGIVYAINKSHKTKQETPHADLVPVTA